MFQKILAKYKVVEVVSKKLHKMLGKNEEVESFFIFFFSPSLAKHNFIGFATFNNCNETKAVTYLSKDFIENLLIQSNTYEGHKRSQYG